MFRSSLSKGLLATAALALSIGVTTPVRADIIFYDTPGAIQPEENVLLPSGQTGLTINGITNQTNTAVLFTQPPAGNPPVNVAEPLTTPSSGQARIASVDPSFTSLRTALAGGSTFTLFEANPTFLSAGVTFTVGVMEPNGQYNTRTNFVSGAGQSYFGMQAINGQRISFVEILAPLNSIQDVRQIRIGGIAVAPVPEPGVVAFAAVNGLGVLGLMIRARRRKLSA